MDLGSFLLRPLRQPFAHQQPCRHQHHRQSGQTLRTNSHRSSCFDAASPASAGRMDGPLRKHARCALHRASRRRGPTHRQGISNPTRQHHRSGISECPAPNQPRSRHWHGHRIERQIQNALGQRQHLSGPTHLSLPANHLRRRQTLSFRQQRQAANHRRISATIRKNIVK